MNEDTDTVGIVILAAIGILGLFGSAIVLFGPGHEVLRVAGFCFFGLVGVACLYGSIGLWLTVIREHRQLLDDLKVLSSPARE